MKHVSPDGRLVFVYRRNGDDTALGFEGFAWHTHGDILAALSGLPEADAVRRYIDDLLEDRAIIAVSRIGGEISDAWITDDPDADRKHKPDDEEIEFRYWSGRRWGGM